MKLIEILQDVISGVLSAVIATVLIGAVAWLAWPFRWRRQGAAIRKLIADERRLNFIFNPNTKMAKEITFLANGSIGLGKNDNENSWRIRRGTLEIIASDQKIYSRFRYERATGHLLHTNDPELRSIPGQYMQPRLVRVAKAQA